MFTSFRRSSAIAGALAVFVALITTATSPGLAAAPDEAPAIQQTSSAGRLAGADRYATAVEVAREVGNGSLTGLDRLIVVTGETFPDGLTASGLAGHLDTGGTSGRTAILLTRTESLPAVTDDAISASNVPASRIVIVGGPSAVSEDVHAAVARAAGWSGAGTNPVTRVYGRTRYETASAVAEFVQQQAGDGLANSYRTVLVANGVDFPDALAAGGLAYRNGHVILLSRPATSPTTTLTSITDLSATCAVLLGGTAALSPTVDTQVTTALTPGGCGVDRVGGSNRYGTAALIAERFTRSNGAPRSAILVSGTEFADALTAAPLAGNRRPILLTGPNGLPPETSTWLTTNAATLDNIAVIGGTDAIDNSSVATANITIIDYGSGTEGGGGGNTPKGLVAISSGNNHSCQILDGSVSCWGKNGSGQLGVDPLTTTDCGDGPFSPKCSTNPAAVSSGDGFQNTNVTAVASGYEHTCAIEDGSVYCWGYNGYGQIGNGASSFGPGQSAPVKVLSGSGFTNSDVTAIATGDDHTCAIEAGSVYCWGSQAYGALGNGGALWNFAPQSTPVKVIDGTTFQNSNVTAIAAGDEFTCAIQGGSAYCWGDNNDGKLGDGSGNSSSTPVTVSNGGGFTNSNVTAISAGFYHACVIQAGASYCWGANFSGNLGNGTTTASTTPVKVSVGDSFQNTNVTAISAGTAHTCAIEGGVLYCWGGNDDGRLGNGTNTNSPSPVMVNSVGGGFTNSEVIVVTAGHVFTCAVQGESAYCWGTNWQGFLGNGTTTDSNVPVLVGGVGDA